MVFPTGIFESFIFKSQTATRFHYYSVLPGFAEDNHIFLGHKTILQSSLLASVYLSWADKSVAFHRVVRSLFYSLRVSRILWAVFA